MKQSITDEVLELESYIEDKVDKKIKEGQNKWSKMTTKQKLDLIFVTMGIVAFTFSALSHLKKLRNQ